MVSEINIQMDLKELRIQDEKIKERFQKLFSLLEQVDYIKLNSGVI